MLLYAVQLVCSNHIKPTANYDGMDTSDRTGTCYKVSVHKWNLILKFWQICLPVDSAEVIVFIISCM